MAIASMHGTCAVAILNTHAFICSPPRLELARDEGITAQVFELDERVLLRRRRLPCIVRRNLRALPNAGLITEA